MPERNKYVFTVEDQQSGLRIDKYLQECLENFSRSAIQRLIEDEAVFVNGNTIPKNYKLSRKDEITLVVPDPQELELAPENIPLDVV